MFIIHALQALKVLWDSAPILQVLWSKFSNAITMGLVCICIWAGLNIVRERDFVVGLQVAFTDSTKQQIERENLAHTDQMQQELRNVAQSNRAIKGILQNVLASTPGAARVRFAIIHNGVSGITRIPLLRFDITSAVSAPGRMTGELSTNLSLSDWDDYIHELLAGRCVLQDVSTMKSLSARARLEYMGVRAFSACPVVDARDQMLGALFVAWDKGDVLPEGDALAKVQTASLRSASQIAGAMEALK